ncbi:MAG TPA: DOMON-like domain-containing protein [Allosphingosinicella sp.]|jgi:hypothetical protein
MRQPLHLHPGSTCGAVAGIEAEALRCGPAGLRLHYVVTGAIGELLIPPPAAPRRQDGLWQHSCFEAFVRSGPEEAYFELNFAPSGEWAAYRFDDYRAGMADADLPPPRITTRADAARFELEAEIALPPFLADASWQLGLSAVIEERSGRKSYWALRHPPGKADFHHPESFALQLDPVRP